MCLCKLVSPVFGGQFLNARYILDKTLSFSGISGLGRVSVSIVISVRGGGGAGGGSPQLWRNFQKSSIFGQILPLVGQKCLQTMGFVSGRPLDFFVPYAYVYCVEKNWPGQDRLDREQLGKETMKKRAIGDSLGLDSTV